MATVENSTGSGELNETEVEHVIEESFPGFVVAAVFVFLVSILGIIGNILVFWYLGFCIKRTKYTVYIINLAAADLIFLIFIPIVICVALIFFLVKSSIKYAMVVICGLVTVFDFGNYAGMFFLTAISVERCLAVLYPMWYNSKRPKLQTIIVCVIIWVLSAFMTLIDNLGCPPAVFFKLNTMCTGIYIFISVIVFLICIPTMVISSLILLIKIRRTSKQVQPRKLIIVIVVSVVVFLISVAPMRLLWLLIYLRVLSSTNSEIIYFFIVYSVICLNCSVNPYIYFLVGRHKMRGFWEYLEKALKNVFKEEEEEAGPDRDI